tara:strand:- start:3321 stop:3755 length:435 start_codon:yes stop_codon:yes gene_type:complete
MSLAHKIPMEVLNKIFIMRPRHPVAKIINWMWFIIYCREDENIKKYILDNDPNMDIEDFNIFLPDIGIEDFTVFIPDPFHEKAEAEYKRCVSNGRISPHFNWKISNYCKCKDNNIYSKEITKLMYQYLQAKYPEYNQYVYWLFF